MQRSQPGFGRPGESMVSGSCPKGQALSFQAAQSAPVIKELEAKAAHLWTEHVGKRRVRAGEGNVAAWPLCRGHQLRLPVQHLSQSAQAFGVLVLGDIALAVVLGLGGDTVEDGAEGSTAHSWQDG